VHQVVMKLDKLKFLNTAQIPQQIQRLVFGGNEGEHENNNSISKEIALPDAETTSLEVEKGLEELRSSQGQAGCPVPPFVPYTQTIPWHSGTRNMFSKFFPRYGNYCGPNYSSGRESGSPHWDKPPTDWLDYCCYRHDMGYSFLFSSTLLCFADSC
jgi:hypothetical protein